MSRARIGMRRLWIATLLAMAGSAGAATPITYRAFELPDASPGTLFVAGINDGGLVAGDFGTDSGAGSVGFTRMRRGPIHTPVVDPDDTEGFTNLRAVNDEGVIAGFYLTRGKAHGLLLAEGVFTTWDLPGAVGRTLLRGINNRGDLAGTFFSADGSEPSGFIAPSSGPVIVFRHPNPAATELVVGKINDQRTVVGYYTTATSALEGFIRYADGTFVDVGIPGADATQVFGVNDCGVIVGTYAVYPTFSTHGFYGRPGQIHLFDLPGSVGTRARGINNRGEVVGDFLDSHSNWHVFVTDHLPHASCVD